MLYKIGESHKHVVGVSLEQFILAENTADYFVHHKSVCLAGGESAIVTFAPIRSLHGISFAALGLTNMLNCGGAVLECQLLPGTSTNGRESRKAGSGSSVTGEDTSFHSGKAHVLFLPCAKPFLLA